MVTKKIASKIYKKINLVDWPKNLKIKNVKNAFNVKALRFKQLTIQYIN